MPRVAGRDFLFEGSFPDRLKFLNFLVGQFHTEYRNRRGCGAKGGQRCRERHEARPSAAFLSRPTHRKLW
jgi:hypothetical protein